jgi:hypothetical protein
MIVLIDGDIVVYRAAFAAERKTYVLKDRETGDIVHQFGVGVTCTQVKELLKGTDKEKYRMSKQLIISPPGFACNNAKKIMNEILKNCETGDYELYLTSGDKSNYRYKVATTLAYKANRKPEDKPVHYEVVREYLLTYWDAKVVYNAEADDILALRHRDEDTIVATIDKDLKQIPGLYYNIGKKHINNITQRIADMSFYEQMLLGDTADNIPGLKRLMSKRVGKETVIKWLECYDAFSSGEAWFYDTLRNVCKWKVPFTEVEKLIEEITPLLKVGDPKYLKDMRIE